MTLYHWPRLLRTVRHLHWSQVTHRLLRPARRRWLRSGADRHDRLAIDQSAPAAELPRIPVSRGTRRESDQLIDSLRRGELRLLNRTVSLGSPPDWQLGPRHEHRLWIVTLHYHQWLYELAEIIRGGHPRAGEAETLLAGYLSDWLAHCDLSQTGTGELVWNSYAIATRLGWWGRLGSSLGESFWRRHGELRRVFLASMWRQARHLFQHLEWDLRANHLLRDAVGLAWAGRCFRGPEPRRWQETAARIANAQGLEQVLADGGHFERSPMYHLEVMDDWLALAQLLPQGEAKARARRAWQQMADYIAWLRHPDGQIPQFNDAARRRPESHLECGAQLDIPFDPRLRQGGRHLTASGVIAWQGRPWTVFFDVGEIGPDYQPGHAHADTLTLEASYDGRRLFVDPGCFGYDNDLRRKYDRSTDAHNTVCVDGQDSSEVWHIFRVGRRARPAEVRATIAQDALQGSGSHDGYKRLPGSPRHTRAIQVGEAAPLVIRDQIAGCGRHRLSGGFLLATDWVAHPAPGGWRLASGTTRLRVDVRAPSGVALSLVQRPLHPDFGVEVTAERLQWCYDGPLPLRVEVQVGPAE